MKKWAAIFLWILMANQTLTYAKLVAGVTHVLAGVPNSNNPPLDIINRACNYVFNWRDWSWRDRPISVNIVANQMGGSVGSGVWAYDPTHNANVTGSAAWAAAGYPPIYLDKTGIIWVYWPNHGLTSGFFFGMNGVTATTGDTTSYNGVFMVTSTPDANTFTYINPGAASNPPPQDITIPATNAGGIGGTNGYGFWVNAQYPLPSDFASMKTLKAAPRSFRGIEAVSLSQLTEYRQMGFVMPYVLYYAIGYAPQTSPDVEPINYLYMFPPPIATIPGFLQGFYTRRAPAFSGSDNNQIADMPSHMFDVLYHTARWFAKGTEEDTSGFDAQMAVNMLQKYSDEDGITQQPAGYLKRTVFDGDAIPFNGQFYPQGVKSLVIKEFSDG